MNPYLYNALLILVGLVGLVGGGELMVRGASALAAALRVPPLIIGLTIVAFGTSAPELGVSLQAAAAGSVDLAVGNVIGSNIFNILLILGIAALVTPLLVASRLIRTEVPLMIAASVLTYVLAFDGDLGRLDGVLLVAVLAVYLGLCFVKGRSESKQVQAEFEAEYGQRAATGSKLRMVTVNLVLMIVGLTLLAVGAKVLVDGSVALATMWGVRPMVIGLTIIATGTSLPEVVTSVVASVRGQRDIAVGNVVGSNIFNLAMVLGISALVAPGGVPVADETLWFDFPIMLAVTIVALPIFFTGGEISRWEGGLLLFYYVVYTTLIVLMQTSPEQASSLQWALVWFVLPLTMLALLISLVRSIARRVAGKGE